MPDSFFLVIAGLFFYVIAGLDPAIHINKSALFLIRIDGIFSLSVIPGLDPGIQIKQIFFFVIAGLDPAIQIKKEAL